MSNFEKLLVWQKSMDLVMEIYRATEKFPVSEKFGLTSQMRRAAVSIPSNIAEGCDRITKKDFSNFLVIAKSSAGELETQILIATNLKYLVHPKKDELIKRMLTGLRKKVLETSSQKLATP
ncbi:MAG: four helix bundle protein [Candidatus Peribacteraceae bacterium]|nr:four helix bundle protein [Candidatus Peribacteraceae bacterium]